MDAQELQNIIAAGENDRVEFKRCGNQPEKDLFESICAFANTFGGSILLGVEDNGGLRGIAADSVLPISRNILNVLNNPNAFDMPIAVEFEHIEIGGRQILKVDVPNSPQMHSYKGKVFERRGDADIVVRGSAPLAELCIRKQSIFTEQRIFDHVTFDDLREDLIDNARRMALAKRKDHPWAYLSNEQLVESAGLYGKDFMTGKIGYNLAAIVLLGKDAVIRSLCPTYKTDALVRLSDTERYDDRLTVTTNLVDAYQDLAAFGRKHLLDRFLMEGDFAVSARDVIVRELLVNCLIHREFTSPFPAKIIIDAEGIRTENASRASFEGPLEPNAFSPLPKNPLIASFFSHIGLAEELGSGTRELFKNSRLYTGRDPELEEGLVFRAFVPTAPLSSSAEKLPAAQPPETAEKALDDAALALELAARSEGVRTSDLVDAGISRRTAQRIMRDLVEQGMLFAHGNGPSRIYRRESQSSTTSKNGSTAKNSRR